jgi:hypothetical protein
LSMKNFNIHCKVKAFSDKQLACMYVF